MSQNKDVTRRQFLQAAPLAAVAAGRMRAQAAKPNLVLVMADDMGFSDIGCYGSEIATPNLDRLAAGGMRMTQFYNCARCCPTRASLLTGLYPHQAGIGYMEPGNRYNKAIQETQGLPAYQGFLNRNCLTLAEALRPAGYQTLMTGKWHVGAEPGQRPCDRGFDRFYGILGGAANHFRPGDSLWRDNQPIPAPSDFYSSDAFSDEAARFIRESERDKPLFLYTAFTAPHWPIQAPEETIVKYRDRYRMGWDALRRERFLRQKAMGLLPADARLSPRHPESYPWEEADQEDMALRMAVYAAMIDRMDQGVGRIWQALEETGRADNTLFLFLSDNGACAEPYGRNSTKKPGPADSNTGVFLPWANASNTPFRIFKHWTHEGGIRSPLVAYWLGRIPAGSLQTRRIGHVKDVMATFLEAAEASYPEQRAGQELAKLQGRSLLASLLDPKRAGNETLFWEHEGNRAVRDGRWKLVSYFNEVQESGGRVGTGRRSGDWELYDLESDCTELRNLAQVLPKRRAAMEAQYETWARSHAVEDWETLIGKAGYADFADEP